jgi:hypothetical protein
LGGGDAVCGRVVTEEAARLLRIHRLDELVSFDQRGEALGLLAMSLVAQAHLKVVFLLCDPGLALGVLVSHLLHGGLGGLQLAEGELARELGCVATEMT